MTEGESNQTGRNPVADSPEEWIIQCWQSSGKFGNKQEVSCDLLLFLLLISDE